jgi:polyisoprenoid-binding protein YceI
MKKLIFLGMVGFAALLSAFAPIGHSKRTVTATAPRQADTWTIDKPHTNVKFSVSHLVISDVDGNFKSFDGKMVSSKPDFSDAKITFTADVSSISTDNEKRDAHLKSNDFFAADSFPQIKFVSSAFTPLGNNKYKLAGYLTIRNVTNQVTFDVKYGGTVNMYGLHAGFKATTTINRQDYNLKFGAKTDSGEKIVGDNVDITINADFKKA